MLYNMDKGSLFIILKVHLQLLRVLGFPPRHGRWRLLCCETRTQAEGRWVGDSAPAHPAALARGSPEAPQNHARKATAVGTSPLQTQQRDGGNCSSSRVSRQGQRRAGTFGVPARHTGPTFPVSFASHPPNPSVLLCCLREAGKPPLPRARGGRPHLPWVPALEGSAQSGAKSNQTSRIQLVYPQRLSRGTIALINTRGVNARQGDELFKDNVGARTEGIN